MALQDYARAVVFFDGRQVKLAESWDLELESGQQPILILNEGLGGFTPGAGQANFGGTLYVPVGGFEEPVDEWVVDGNYVTVQFGVGPNAYVGNGKFTNVKISQSTNQALQVTFQWVGEKKKFD